MSDLSKDQKEDARRLFSEWVDRVAEEEELASQVSAIESGFGYRDKLERPGAIGSVSIHGRHYCDRCTLKHDSE